MSKLKFTKFSKIIFITIFLALICCSNNASFFSSPSIVIPEANEEQKKLMDEIQREIDLILPEGLTVINEYLLSLLHERIQSKYPVLKDNIYDVNNMFHIRVAELFDSDETFFIDLLSSNDHNVKIIALRSLMLSKLNLASLLENEVVHAAIQEICDSLTYQSTREEVKENYLKALYWTGLFENCFEAIIELTKDESQPVLAEQAAQLLCYETTDCIVPVSQERLEELLKVQSVNLHREVVLALAFYEYEPIIPELIEMIEDENMKSLLRARAIDAISDFEESKPQELLDCLHRMLWPEKWFVFEEEGVKWHSLEDVLDAFEELHEPLTEVELLMLKSNIITILPDDISEDVALELLEQQYGQNN